MMESQHHATVVASGGDTALETNRTKASAFKTVGGEVYTLLPQPEDADALAPFVLNDPELRNLLAVYLDLNTMTVREDYLALDGGVAVDGTELSCFGRGCRENWDATQGLPCTLSCPHGPSHVPSNGVPRGFIGQGVLSYPDGEPVGDGVSLTEGVCNVDYTADLANPTPIQDPTGQGYQLVTDACPSLMLFFNLFKIPAAPGFALNVAIFRNLKEVLGRAGRAYREHVAATAAATPAAPVVAAPVTAPAAAPGVPPVVPVISPVVQPAAQAQATAAPVIPGQVSQPPAQAQPQPPAPWASADCLACSSSPNPGFASNGLACSHCDTVSKAAGGPVSGDYVVTTFSWAERPPAATAAVTPPGLPVAPAAPAVPPATSEAPTDPPDPTDPPETTSGDTVEAKALVLRDWLVTGAFTTERQSHGPYERGLVNGGVEEGLKRLKRLGTNRKILSEDGVQLFATWAHWYVATHGIMDDLATNPRKSAGWKALVEKCGGDLGLAHSEALALGAVVEAPVADDPFGADLDSMFDEATPALIMVTPEMHAAEAALDDEETLKHMGSPMVFKEILATLLRIDQNIAVIAKRQSNQRLPPDVS